jgi:hypothetical protein
MADHPLAQDYFGRPISLPENVSGFLVWRVPSKKGGKPQPFPSLEEQLEVKVEMNEAQLLELVERPGRYRLDPVDSNGEPVAVKPCWVTLKGEAATNGEMPRPANATEWALVQMAQANCELVRITGEAHAEVLKASARHLAPQGSVFVEDGPTGRRDVAALPAKAIEDGADADFDWEKAKKVVELGGSIFEQIPKAKPAWDLLKAMITEKQTKPATPPAVAAAPNGTPTP